jgi:hypothetical protein
MSADADLAAMADDLAPVLLEPESTPNRHLIEAQLEGEAFRKKWTAISSHARLEAASAALASDPGLAAVGETGPEGQQVFLSSPPSGGGQMQLETLPQLLLMAAAQEAHLVEALGQTAHLPTIVLKKLKLLKAAIRGEEIEMYRLIGYAGLLLEPGTHLDTPWGRIVSASSIAVGLPSHMHLRLLENSSAVLISTTRWPFRLGAYVPGQLSKDRAHRSEDLTPTQYLIPLAVTLGSDPYARLGPAPRWNSVAAPWWGFSSSHVVLGQGRLFYDRTALGSAERHRIEQWCRVLERRFIPELATPIRRIESAAGVRTEPIDTLVDAWIALEGLVGTGDEVTFRVTAALAYLLDRGAGSRAPLRKALARLYDLRSKLVHGHLGDAWQVVDGHPKLSVNQAAQLTLEVAVQTVQLLILRRPSLLPLSSEARADRLVLGAS